ncbi:MAG: M23/M56 family metallopeptidase [Oscillospiraceae bacterium]
MQAMFLTMLSYMPWVSAAIVFVLLLRKLFPTRFSSKLYKSAYILLAIRIVLPFDFALKSAPIAINVPAIPQAPQPTIGAIENLQSTLSPALPAVAQEFNLLSVLPVIWVIGALLSVAAVLISYFIFAASLYRQRKEMDSGFIYDALNGKVKLYTSCRCFSPVLIGFIRPVLYVPSDAQDADEAKMLVGHELCHKQNMDLFAKLLLILARSVAWFNPLIYLMANDAQRCIELACDETVLCSKGIDERCKYGKMLLDSYTRGTKSQYLCAPFARGGKDVKRRFTALLDTNIKKRGTAIFAMLLCFTLIASVCISCTAKPETASSQAPEIKPSVSDNSASTDAQIPASSSVPLKDAASGANAAAQSTSQGNSVSDASASIAPTEEPIAVEVPSGDGKVTMQNPLPDATVISRDFSNGHRGIDLAAPKDSPIYAAADGEVLVAEFDETYGNTVIISHGNGVTSQYSHASSLEVEKGDSVKAGALIAKVGSTGNSSGNHLHFETTANGKLVNPKAYIVFNLNEK